MNELPLNQVLCGDNREVMKTLPGDSIDLAVTSPPYWGLRDYGLGENQLGLEPHPQQYIDNLVEISKEIRRVIKPRGSYWLNLGDTYYGSGKGAGGDGSAKERYIPDVNPIKQNLRSNWLQPKQLLGIPWRVATALQEDGWVLRNCVIWYKPNHMPESVKDRLTKSYEFFFFFVKQKKYYFNLDNIRIPYDPNVTRWGGNIMKIPPNEKIKQGTARALTKEERPWRSGEGKNPGDMWSIPTYPFPGAHFAVFPPALIEPIIKAGCPKNGVVLDPFAGSGTALRVARKLGRRFIGIDINPEYVEMCERRVRADTYISPPEGVPTLTELLDRE